MYDLSTGLTWQKGGDDISFPEIEGYLMQLNQEKFGGYSDWRVPTLAEAWTLLEYATPASSNPGVDPVHIDPVFDTEQYRIWTSSIDDNGWFIFFEAGRPVHMKAWGSHAYLRAVRWTEFK